MTDAITPHRPRRGRIEAGCGEALIELLNPDPVLRRYAVDAVELDAVGLYALRDRLLGDTHGPVRVAVAERLARAARRRFGTGAPTRDEAAQWLLEALQDPLPSVREVSCRAVARHLDRGPEIEARLAQMLTSDPSWRTRRAAARALAAVAGEGGISGLIPGLEDPFWRVRHAVIQALALIAARSSDEDDQRARVREQILAAGAHLQEAARAALAYLASGWPEGEGEVPAVLGLIRDPGFGLELSDPDPAVVTARLLAASAVDPDKLVPLLAESHVPLREEAARRLASVDDPTCLLPALAWLEDPRVPNAPAIVRRLLDRIGDRAEPLVERALDSGRPGAIEWALTWIASYAGERLHARLPGLAAHANERVRAALVRTCRQLIERERGQGAQLWAGLIEEATRDPSPSVREAAALALADRDLVNLVGEWSDANLGPRARARVVELARDSELSEHGMTDPDVRVRLAAIGDGSALSPSWRARMLADADPWIRAASLDRAAALASLLGDDERDPSVRRIAARLLVREREQIEPTTVVRLLARASADADPWVRARALDLIQFNRDDAADDPELLAACLLATRDAAAMVRLSASAKLDVWPQLADRLEHTVTDGRADQAELCVAAWSRLIVELEPEPARARVERGIVELTDPRVRAHLLELAVVFGADPPSHALANQVSATSPRPAWEPPPPALVSKRALGRTGIELAPLVISGALSPTPSSLAQAAERGVDTWFWEPRHANLTRFLRQPIRRGQQVIAGSFHADRRGLTHDLELARRRLQRDHIDLFLLFWVRSPARLDPASLETLREFQRRGSIRSYGFSTHDRSIACAAIDSGDWPVIMTRHSAAHDGAEHELLPAAAAAGVGVLGFSALCYGRMLRPSAVFEQGAPAPDCYRYSLSQPAVAACISAPSRHRELVENLDVLDASTIDGSRQEVLRAHGKEIYADNKRFDRLLRRGGTAPLREAILELFERASEPSDAETESVPSSQG
ncbi:aldo/keto reductase [Enhygromyxa salina]|uniref:HEAT repeat protein n=1 Tax=Enhygromyxa salina TaxID=215803 RepID=A0A2S9YQ32_9BACT|nr:aldo/keto reductase [Enhygromyxa salina]PRQ07197.1 HEAT repeat protein [Enhygromyxa salina]